MTLTDTLVSVHSFTVSIAYMYTDAYFSITVKAMEDAFALGLLIVTVAGNDGNVRK
jgi:hypothetical protein